MKEGKHEKADVIDDSEEKGRAVKTDLGGSKISLLFQVLISYSIGLILTNSKKYYLKCYR